MNEAVREMTFEEEAALYEKEARELFAKENPGYEAPPINHTVRRGMRIIRKAREEIEWLSKRWISVNDKLPERGQSVLILCKNKAMFTGYQLPDYNKEARWRVHTALNSTKLLNRGRVTHWMPLPEGPEVEI